MKDCGTCGKPIKNSHTVTEQGAKEMTVPEETDDICVDITYIGGHGHEAEVDIIFHEGDDNE